MGTLILAYFRCIKKTKIILKLVASQSGYTDFQWISMISRPFTLFFSLKVNFQWKKYCSVGGPYMGLLAMTRFNAIQLEFNCFILMIILVALLCEFQPQECFKNSYQNQIYSLLNLGLPIRFTFQTCLSKGPLMMRSRLNWSYSFKPGNVDNVFTHKGPYPLGDSWPRRSYF